MILKYGVILLSFYIILPKICAGQYNDAPWGLKDTIDFNALLYEEACKENAEAEWKFINDPSDENRLAWEQAQAGYGLFKRKDVANIHNETISQSDDDMLSSHQLSVEKTPGDMLLNASDWEKLVSFSAKATALRIGSSHMNETENHSRHETEKLLLGNNKVEDKRSAWTSWHRRLSPLMETFSSTLPLLSKASEANGAENVAKYWELLSVYTDDGYEKIKHMWEEIDELHKKLVAFVQNRLSQKYKIKISDAAIPAYLLGSLDGNDWTSIASDVLPYRDVTYSIMKSLWDKNLRGVSLYRTASVMGKSVFKRGPLADFWQMSKFNQTCLTQLINFCREGTRVLTCHQASISNFLTAHKIVAKVLTNQMKIDGDAQANSVFNTANRYSGLDEAVSEFFSILSVSPGQLVALDLIDNTTETEQSKISSLMITALDVLPRLAYYISADLWRIESISNGTLMPNQLIQSWWEYRKRYEGVTSDSSDIPTFLDDDFIINNKPYLPKFVGTVLGFQLYQELSDTTEVRYDSASQFQVKPEFVTMLQYGGAAEWTNVIYDKLGVYDISATPLISYFAPLRDYLENNLEDISPLTSAQEAELRRVEEKYDSIDVTTTPKPATTFAPTLMPKNPKQPPKKSTTTLPVVPPVISTENPVISTEKSIVSKDEYSTTKDSQSDYANGINTSKAVWAVAIVLVATITICIIAIFGRRRCIKSQTPKNRRYV